MDTLGLLDQVMYRANQYDVASIMMGGASILAPASKSDPLDAQAIADHLVARFEHIPLLRKKMVQDPLHLGSVRRVIDPGFSVSDHVSVEQVPGPGDQRELTAAIASLSSTPLKQGQLWRWTVLDGIEGGRVALVCKINHALADGLGIMQVLTSIYDPAPVSPEQPTELALPYADEPTPYALLGDALAESAGRLLIQTPRFFVKNTGPMLRGMGSGVRRLWESRRDDGGYPVLPQWNHTSLNIDTSSGRRSLAYTTLSTTEVKALGRAAGGTANDVGLFLFSHALQHYFGSIGEEIEFDLWCGMPISTRSADSNAGNQVTIGRVNLHNRVQDAAERLQAIAADSAQIKARMRPDEPAVDMAGLGALVFPALVDGLLYVAGKLNVFGAVGNKVPLFNALFSNVPGPTSTLYFANGAVVESIPLIPAVEVIGLSGGITSVGDSFTLGFHCDANAVADPELFVQGVDKGMGELRRASGKPRQRRKTAAPSRGRTRVKAGTASSRR